MARKFLSFLGTGDYVPANYYFKDQKICAVDYVQEALVQIFCKDWDKKDKICVFCTKGAEEKNWQGLYSRLCKTRLKPEIKKIDIPEGKSEEEIWEIFERVFDTLEKKETIIFDITHSFRSLPMLNLVVLNYAKFLKEVQIGGIYYGAFEVLGPPDYVKKIYLLKKEMCLFLTLLLMQNS